MVISGIVCEYNPFHKGHAYQINSTRNQLNSTHIIGIMSGNYVQRGDFAIYDKWIRAENAIKGGADLILELPTYYSLSSAEIFARGSVGILDLLNCIDYISFGSESGNIKKIELLANEVDETVTKQNFSDNLKEGMSYHKALDTAMGKNSFVNSPNDLLGIEYVRALKYFKSHIKPYTVQRFGEVHDSKNNSSYPSASFIRKQIIEGLDYYPNNNIHVSKYVQSAILAKLRTMSTNDMQQCANVSEGIEARVIKAAKTATSLDELYSLIKTKRYPMSRVRRVVFSLFLDMKKQLFELKVPYVKVLAFNDNGRQLINVLKEHCPVPIITKANEIDKLGDNAKLLFDFENRATDLFALACETPQPAGLEYTKSPIYVQKL